MFLHEFRENRLKGVDAQSQTILGILYTIILHSARFGFDTINVPPKTIAENERYMSGIFDNEEK